MNCKFCNAEIPEGQSHCPDCGLEVTVQEEAVQEEAVLEETVQEETAQEPDAQPKQKKWPVVVAIISSVVALCALAALLMVALGFDFKQLLPRPNDIFARDSYVVEDDKAAKKADVVVAQMGGKELSNIQLQLYYRMQVLDFLNYYGDYASYVGLDYTKPLSEQTCYYDDTMTWEQYFLDVAIDTWQNYQTLALLAEEAGHTLGEDWQKSLDELPKNLEEQAQEGEYESVDALLQDVIGPGCDLENYMEYVKLAYISNDFYSSEYERLTPTDDEVAAYFAENEEAFKEQGITKESGLISGVRHILIEPEGGTKDEESGETTYSDDEWAACYAKAEKLLNDWKAGEATQESFAALVKDNTADTGSASTGGLYENIYKGSGMTENFEAWAIDMTRKTGDTGIVKTEFGYHIMYFVSGEAQWLDAARTQLVSERTDAMIAAGEEKWPMVVNYRKIALAELEL